MSQQIMWKAGIWIALWLACGPAAQPQGQCSRSNTDFVWHACPATWRCYLTSACMVHGDLPPHPHSAATGLMGSVQKPLKAFLVVAMGERLRDRDTDKKIEEIWTQVWMWVKSEEQRLPVAALSVFVWTAKQSIIMKCCKLFDASLCSENVETL